MHNKFLNSFLKDGELRARSIVAAVGILFCLVLIRLDIAQGRELNSIQAKQALVSKIPAMQMAIDQVQRAVDGVLLNGIITTQAQPMAVINNTLVKINEEIGGKKVIAIEKSEVTVCNIEQLDQCTVLRLQE